MSREFAEKYIKYPLAIDILHLSTEFSTADTKIEYTC